METDHSTNQVDWLVIAENDNLITVLDCMVSTPFQFRSESSQAYIHLDVTDFAPHDTAPAGGFGIKDLLQPLIGRNWIRRRLGHAPSVEQIGLTFS
ncbi:hypothetical protein [Aliisedimentitalea scapharcae]|uniref:hypothetical protein n=1 Tax=Aliisedimentitalea scapharcae TaxID=1524259 RepID=UPI003872A799